MPENPETERYAPPRIEERTDVASALIGFAVISSNVDSTTGT